MEEVPQVFDWVTARSKCSVQVMFTLLMETIDCDVKATQALSGMRIEFNPVAKGKTVVARLTPENVAVATIIFESTKKGVLVSRGGPARKEELFTAIPSMQADGRCRYEVNEAPLELWQVSRRALEPVFFGEFDD